MSSTAPSFRSLVGIPPSTASVQDSTLIIIDAQNEYASGLLQVKHVESSRKAIAELLSRYRQHGDGKNIVHVVHQVPDNAPVFTPGTPLAEEFQELTPRAGEKVVRKQHPSAFAQTDLHDYLGGLGARGKKIVLVGYMAHICISTTARAGSERGYDIVVAQDGVGDRDIPGVDADQLVSVVLKELADGFGTVVSVADIAA